MFDMVIFFTISVGVLGLLKGCFECSQIYQRMSEERANLNETEENQPAENLNEDMSENTIENNIKNNITKVNNSENDSENDLENKLENELENNIKDLPSYSEVAKFN